MILFIIRHGIAIDLGAKGVKIDEARYLSEKGVKRTNTVAQALLNLQCKPDEVYSSPLVRAYQTAEILCNHLCRAKKPAICNELSPGGDISALIKWLGKQKAQSMMVVGHMPDLALLASALLSKNDEIYIVFKKAGACRISFEGKLRPGAGALEWLMQPKHFKKWSGGVME